MGLVLLTFWTCSISVHILYSMMTSVAHSSCTQILCGTQHHRIWCTMVTPNTHQITMGTHSFSRWLGTDQPRLAMLAAISPKFRRKVTLDGSAGWLKTPIWVKHQNTNVQAGLFQGFRWIWMTCLIWRGTISRVAVGSVMLLTSLTMISIRQCVGVHYLCPELLRTILIYIGGNQTHTRSWNRESCKWVITRTQLILNGSFWNQFSFKVQSTYFQH